MVQNLKGNDALNRVSTITNMRPLPVEHRVSRQNRWALSPRWST